MNESSLLDNEDPIDGIKYIPIVASSKWMEIGLQYKFMESHVCGPL
jgi:hypothetical protein